MKLYHGTNINFANIDLAKCLPFKDFGRGFYLTPAKWRARVRALDKVDKEHVGVPIVMTYNFDVAVLSELNVLRFSRCNEQWLDFILSNRNRRTAKEHSYDIVIGPVADDGVITSIALYESQVIGRKELLNRIKEVTPYTQYAFCTQKAIEKLHRI